MRFVKVMPRDYKAVLLKEKEEKAKAQTREDVKEANGTKTNETKTNEKVQTLITDIEDIAKSSKQDKPIDKLGGFRKYTRVTDTYRDPSQRTTDWKEINQRLDKKELKKQTARCMDCGVPFCQSSTGCPLGNIIPKWNELVFREQWKEALDRLLMTNNFPEFTGRVCPAPCEGACVLGITETPVSIKSIECAIVDRAFEEGWIVPVPPTVRTGRRVAIIGSGPAGLAAADLLNRARHFVTVYERNDRIGGLLIYGIPNMKLDKRYVERRVKLLQDEGVEFITSTSVGRDVTATKVRRENDAVLIATGATWPRDLSIPNRQLNGIYFAMDFLQANTKSLLDSKHADGAYISARGRKVIVIGGGDTGCDCIGTATRQGAESIVNFELLPRPPNTRAADNPWPEYPRVFKIDYGHAEVQAHSGRDPREYCIMSKEFVSDGAGNVKGINTVRVEWTKDATGRWNMKEVAGSEEFFAADLVLLAMGFLGPEKDLLANFGVKTDPRSNIETPTKSSYETNVAGVFAAGDCRRGQSLVVWAINEGRQAARQMDMYLMGDTLLPVSGGIKPRSFNLLQYRKRAGLIALSAE